MSRTLSLVLLAAAVLATAGCTTTRADGSPRIQTTSQANRESVQGAVVFLSREHDFPETPFANFTHDGKVIEIQGFPVT